MSLCVYICVCTCLYVYMCGACSPVGVTVCVCVMCAHQCVLMWGPEGLVSLYFI